MGTGLGFVAYAVAKYVISAVIAVLAIFAGLKIFDRLTHGIDEMKEIKKGNSAVAIYFVSIAVSIAIFLMPAIGGLAKDVNQAFPLSFQAVIVAVDIAKVFAMLLVAIFTLTVAFMSIDSLTGEISELKELKSGNMAVAILVAGILVSMSIIIQSGVGDIISSGSLDTFTIAKRLSGYVGVDASACVQNPVLETQGPGAKIDASACAPS
ncbi:DUF350 domain-containing protein [Candidatus Parvarchaeota archaeon]|nr:DUF350 domain-containing protein [Candidatus Parvarchaeota archaeon]